MAENLIRELFCVLSALYFQQMDIVPSTSETTQTVLGYLQEGESSKVTDADQQLQSSKTVESQILEQVELHLAEAKQNGHGTLAQDLTETRSFKEFSAPPTEPCKDKINGEQTKEIDPKSKEVDPKSQLEYKPKTEAVSQPETDASKLAEEKCPKTNGHCEAPKTPEVPSLNPELAKEVILPSATVQVFRVPETEPEVQEISAQQLKSGKGKGNKRKTKMAESESPKVAKVDAIL